MLTSALTALLLGSHQVISESPGARHAGNYWVPSDMDIMVDTVPSPSPRLQSAPPPGPSPLEQKYETLRNATCAKVIPHVPVLPEQDCNNFMKAYQNFTGDTDESPLYKLANVLLSRQDLQKFLTLPDSFKAEGLDADMVLCAVLYEATPKGLAAFAGQGTTEENLVDTLLKDTLLMRDMLVAGGASGGNYGQAMQIYTQLTKASTYRNDEDAVVDDPTYWDDRSQNKASILKRLALGISVGHAVPIRYRWVTDPNNTNVDPVQRYLHYEQAYLAGELDPAFEVLTAFEYRHATDADARDDDLVWMRQTLENYRPDNIARDYSWRYAESVHTDVAYGHPACDDMPGICTGSYAQIPAAGGECGPRAFFGRITRKAFGIPTWGCTQPGHAAMTTWNPDGWRVLLGADWPYSWWNSRGGPDFHLEAQCRELRSQYQQVLRGNWVADARGEDPVGQSWTPRSHSGYGTGGLWAALMLYHKKITVNSTVAPTRPIGPSVVPTKVDALIARWSQPLAIPNITTGKDGTITIPAVSYTIKNHSTSVSVLHGFPDNSTQLISNHGDLVDPDSSAFGYEVTLENGGTYYLTTNFSTWHMNQDLLVTTNTTKSPVTVPVYYTLGYWNETQPIEVKLLQGLNVIKFTRTSDRDIAFKDFFLFTKAPVVPPAPANYTPAPTPSPDSYIELPASTTCLKQGLTEVPEKWCGRACALLGLKFTGAKVRPNGTACFALTDGQWKGNCNYNSNTSAVCANPPCQLFGSTIQAICQRK